MIQPIVRVAVAMLFTAVLAACATDKSAGQVIDDTTITARVKSALIADKTTKAHQINVDTYKGEVQLSGYVDTQEAKVQAESVARAIPGVTDVRNNLVVK